MSNHKITRLRGVVMPIVAITVLSGALLVLNLPNRLTRPTSQKPLPKEVLKEVSMQGDFIKSTRTPDVNVPISSTADVSRNPLSREDAEALHTDSVRVQAVEKQARLLFKQGRFAQAEEECRRAMMMQRSGTGETMNMSALQLLGDIYLQQKRYHEAIDTYAKAREHTRNLELDLSMALAYVRLGDLEKASRFYSPEKYYAQAPAEQRKEILSQLPTGKDAKSFEASIFYTLGGEKSSYAATEEAAEAYQKALDLFPHNGRFAYLLAGELARLKRYDEAVPMFARAARFGTGEDAKDAKYRLSGFSAGRREAAKIP